LPPIVVDDSPFMRWLAYTIVLTQNNLSNRVLDNTHQTFSSKEQLIFLANSYISFVKWVPIPVFWRNCRN